MFKIMFLVFDSWPFNHRYSVKCTLQDVLNYRFAVYIIYNMYYNNLSAYIIYNDTAEYNDII